MQYLCPHHEFGAREAVLFVEAVGVSGAQSLFDSCNGRMLCDTAHQKFAQSLPPELWVDHHIRNPGKGGEIRHNPGETDLPLSLEHRKTE